MTVFVTVGTTKFDGLVKAVDDQNFQELLVRKGYKNLIIQLGNGTCHPSAKTDRLNVSWYTLKPSIAEDMKRSSLVISHGGSGCIRESLILHKPLVAVINDSLMDNHQTELVSQLAHDKHLIHSTPQSLYEDVDSLNVDDLIPYESGVPSILGDHINTLLGFDRIS